MIEHFPPESDCAESRLVLRPNRSFTARQTGFFFLLMTLTSASVAGFSYWQGNVFAPLFATAELGLLALVFRLLWRRGERAEVIAVSSSRVAVRRLPELAEVFDANPHWVSLGELDGHLRLSSHGCGVEIGAFLGEAERRRVLDRLRDMLRKADARAPALDSAILG